MKTTVSPIIIIGMHRSGTSLLTKTLAQCGLFIGNDISNHHESLFFLNHNRWIFKVGHADWDNPSGVNSLPLNWGVYQQITAQLKRSLHSWEIRSFLGINHWVRWRGIANVPFRWGWKDPRNTYTLPIWLDLFPEAKVLRIYRNGVDVAWSLQVREKARTRHPDFLNNYLFSSRCIQLDGGFSLWTEYEQQCAKVLSVLPQDKVFQVKFEEFVDNPLHFLPQIIEFLQMPAARDVIQRSVADIRPKRAYAFLDSPELREFYQEKHNHPLIKRLDYDNLV